MSFELSSLGKEFKKNLEGGGKESKIWNYIHPCFYINDYFNVAKVPW